MTSTTSTRAADVPQLRFPGQAAAPEGPVDVRMMYLMHFAFRRDLDTFVAATAATPYDDRAVWAALQQRWHTFTWALEHHHKGEDAGMWPLLMSYADDAERQVLDDMEAEHALIDPLLASCEEGFAAMTATTDPEAGRVLSGRIALTRECLAHHLRHEESGAMAIVQKYLTQKQWDDMAKESFGKDQTFKDLMRTLPWVFHAMPQDLADEMRRYAGRIFSFCLRLTSPRFERAEALAMRYVEPAAGS